MAASLLVVGLFSVLIGASAEIVLVTGATGQTGSLAYFQLKAAGFETRALVRNATKAQAILQCGACSEKEGVYVGDVRALIRSACPCLV